MNPTKLSVPLAIALLTISASSYGQALTGNSLPPSLSGGTVINFDSGAPASYGQSSSSFAALTLNGVTFSGVNGDLTINNFSGDYNCLGNGCLANNQGATNAFRFDFSRPTTKFLFNYGATNDIWTLKAYNSAGQLLGTASVSDISASNAGEYVGFQSSQGIKYAIFEHASGDWILLDNFIFSAGPTAADTLASMQRNAWGLRKTFSQLASYLNPGLSYDCSIFDKNGVCVAFSGRYTGTSGGGPEATSGVLTAAYKVNSSIRVGGFVEQYASDYSSGGVEVKSNNPDFGIFGIWSQTGTDEGLKVRAAYRYGKRDLTITRDPIDTAEAGTGSTKLVTEGAQLTAIYGYNLSNTVLASPYIGVRYTNIGRNSYTESTSDTVTAPLHFDALHQETTSLLAGVNLSVLVAPSVTVNGSVGVETDTERRVGKYSATGVVDLAAIEFNGDTRKTRMVGSVGIAYKIDNTQQISAQAWYREEAYGSTTTTTGMITYAVGF